MSVQRIRLSGFSFFAIEIAGGIEIDCFTFRSRQRSRFRFGLSQQADEPHFFQSGYITDYSRNVPDFSRINFYGSSFAVSGFASSGYCLMQMSNQQVCPRMYRRRRRCLTFPSRLFLTVYLYFPGMKRFCRCCWRNP